MKMSHPRLLLAGSVLVAAIGFSAFWLVQEEKTDRAPVPQVTVAPGAPAAFRAPERVVAPATRPVPVRVAAVPAAPEVTVAPPVAPEVPSRALFGNSFGREPEPALAAFDRWATQYLATPAAERPALLPQGVVFAQARQAVMADLIRQDPRQAIASTVPAAVRQQLPPEVEALLEKRVEAKATLALQGALARPGESVAEPTYRTALVDGEQYRAYVYGRRNRQMTRSNIALHGVALKGSLAVSDSPVRVIEQGEIIDPAQAAPPICPVSGNPTGQGGTESTSAVQIGDKVQPLCHIAHAVTLESDLLAAEDAASTTEADRELAWDLAADGNPGASGVSGRPAVSYSTGTKKLLLIRVQFTDLKGDPGSPASLNSLFNGTTGVCPFYSQTSYGLTTLAFDSSVDTNTTAYMMPKTAAYYAQGNGSDAYNYELHQAAQALAKADGKDPAKYDRVGVLFNWLGDISGSYINYGGLGEVGGHNFWANGEIDFRVCSHELGHTYGLQHCDLWQVSDKNPISDSGSSTDYGDPFGVMGSGNTSINFQFDPWQKCILHWLPDASVPVVKTSGTYRIYRFDSKDATTTNTMAVKLAHNSSKDYWISFRQLFPTNSYLASGAYVQWGFNNAGTHGALIDFNTPGTNPQDAGLSIGTAFRDSVAGVTLKPTAKGGTAPNEYLDVQIDYDPHIQWLTPTFAADQLSGQATVTLTRSGSTSAAVSVKYATADGTAKATANYTASSGTVSWAAGDGTPKTITIPLSTATPVTAITSFSITMSAATGGAILDTPLAATVNIGSSGMVDTSFASNNFSNALSHVVRQPDDKLLVTGSFAAKTGSYGAGFARLNADGTVDTSFYAGTGANALPVTALALQADGKVLIGGNFTTINGTKRARLARLNADGTLDTTFDPGTGADATVNAIAVQPDGQILVGGAFTTIRSTAAPAIARLNPDGTLDSFASKPAFQGSSIHVNTIVLQPSNKILLGGHFNMGNGAGNNIIRLTAAGAVDSTFETGTGALTPGGTSAEVFAIVSQPDGNILLGGSFTSYNGAAHNYMARVSDTGAASAAFAPTPSAAVASLSLQPDGKILLGGSFTSISGTNANRFARLKADGSVDDTFAVGNGSPATVNDWSLQPDGSVLMATGYVSGSTAQELLRVFGGLSGKIGSIQLTAASASGAEGSTITLKATRTGGTTGTVSANYGTQLITAELSRVAPAGGVAPNGTLTWADGDSAAKTFTVPLLSDGTVQQVQTLAVNLAILQGGVIAGVSPRELITISADSADNLPPALTIATPADKAIVLTPTLTISGTATDSGLGGSGILSVKVNGVAATGGSSTASATANWTTNYTLATGINTLTVVATDRAGNSTTKQVTVSFYNAPAIDQQPASQTVVTGSSATLKVTLYSTGATSQTVHYFWYSGLSGDTSTPVGTDSPTLVTPALSGDASYWVRITNANNASTDSDHGQYQHGCPARHRHPAGGIYHQHRPGRDAPGGARRQRFGQRRYHLPLVSGHLRRYQPPYPGTTATYTTVPLTASASYWVRLTNTSDFSTDSATAQVFVNVAPTISAQPGSAHVNPGTPATLSVTVAKSGTADSTVSYQWYAGASGDTSTPVSSTANSFTTPPLSASASFWVRIRNSVGLTADSAAALLVVNTAPVIRTAPQSVSVAKGASATLQVVAGASGTDKPSITYAWFQGVSGDTSKPITGAKSPTLVTPALNPPQTPNSMQFWVQLSNSELITTNSPTATVQITSAPIITAQPPAPRLRLTGAMC